MQTRWIFLDFEIAVYCTVRVIYHEVAPIGLTLIRFFIQTIGQLIFMFSFQIIRRLVIYKCVKKSNFLLTAPTFFHKIFIALLLHNLYSRRKTVYGWRRWRPIIRGRHFTRWRVFRVAGRFYCDIRKCRMREKTRAMRAERRTTMEIDTLCPRPICKLNLRQPRRSRNFLKISVVGNCGAFIPNCGRLWISYYSPLIPIRTSYTAYMQGRVQETHDF